MKKYDIKKEANAHEYCSLTGCALCIAKSNFEIQARIDKIYKKQLIHRVISPFTYIMKALQRGRIYQNLIQLKLWKTKQK